MRSFDEYQARLSEHFVVLEHSERRGRIARELESHARRLGGRVHLKEHAALVEEVADLVELGARRHLLREQGGLDAVKQALQPAEQLGLGDA